MTLPGIGLGTPEYMSPEQAFGESNVDGRTDLYAPPPRAPLPLAAHVEHTLLRALSRNPDDRFSRVEDFIRALSSSSGAYPAAVRSAPPPARSIAVLPFTNTGGDAQDEYWELNVDTVLQGSVRRGGDRLLTDVFEIQDDITRAIVDALRLELLAKPASEAVHDLGAYERYLEARYHWNRRTVTGMRRSVKALQEALTIDESFVAALAALAETHVTRSPCTRFTELLDAIGLP